MFKKVSMSHSDVVAERFRRISDIYTLYISYAMILKGECNIKSGKRSFTGLDTAEPHHILCKDNASEWKESLLSVSRAPLILCKDTAKEVRHKRILFIFKMSSVLL